MWPKKAYRNPTDQLVGFLDKKHDDQWSIFEFRAEGTGYPDDEVYNRIHHFPWPDHHPPPFALVPSLMAAMRNWLQPEKDIDSEKGTQRVAVVHCKAGKGRSGTATCSYLISEEGWKREDALHRFTIRRMRSGFGNGVSIPSQLRWVGYVDRWTNEMSKRYMERPVEIVEVHVQGLRDGVKVCVEGFVDGGRRIKNFHTFTRAEKTIVSQNNQEPPISTPNKEDDEILTTPINSTPSGSNQHLNEVQDAAAQDVILKPPQPIRLETSDMNIDFERRNKVKYTGYAYVTSIAHVWFNAWFEGGWNGVESGLFEIDWEAMDGIKGSARKGIRAFDKMKVVWKYVEQTSSKPIDEPQRGEPVVEPKPADWTGASTTAESEAKHSDGVDSGRRGGAAVTMGAMINQGASTLTKELGLRKEHPNSVDVSRANSVQDVAHPETHKQRTSEELYRAEQEERAVVKPHIPGDTEIEQEHAEDKEGVAGRADTGVGRNLEAGMEKVAHVMAKVRGDDDTKDTKTNGFMRG